MVISETVASVTAACDVASSGWFRDEGACCVAVSNAGAGSTDLAGANAGQIRDRALVSETNDSRDADRCCLG